MITGKRADCFRFAGREFYIEGHRVSMYVVRNGRSYLRAVSNTLARKVVDAYEASK